MDGLLGAELGGYRLVEFLGEGGMAAVFRGENSLDSRIVRAIKLLHAEFLKQPEFIQRFVREAATLEGLQHPNIVRFYGVRKEKEHILLELEFLKGKALSELKEQPRVEEAAGWMRQAAAGLAFAHQQGVLHRDLKPGNLFLTSDGTVKILDFGLARAAEDSRSRHTAVGMVVGTVAYMAPELCEGGEASPASDVYALGICLSEWLLGHHPWMPPGKNPSVPQLMYQHVHGSLPPKPGQVPDGLWKLVLHCTAKNPAERPKNGDEFLKVLIRLEQRKPEQVSKAISKSAVAVPVFEKILKPVAQPEVVSKTSVALPVFSPEPEEQPTDLPKPVGAKTGINVVGIFHSVRFYVSFGSGLTLLYLHEVVGWGKLYHDAFRNVLIGFSVVASLIALGVAYFRPWLLWPVGILAVLSSFGYMILIGDVFLVPVAGILLMIGAFYQAIQKTSVRALGLALPIILYGFIPGKDSMYDVRIDTLSVDGVLVDLGIMDSLTPYRLQWPILIVIIPLIMLALAGTEAKILPPVQFRVAPVGIVCTGIFASLAVALGWKFEEYMIYDAFPTFAALLAGGLCSYLIPTPLILIVAIFGFCISLSMDLELLGLLFLILPIGPLLVQMVHKAGVGIQMLIRAFPVLVCGALFLSLFLEDKDYLLLLSSLLAILSSLAATLYPRFTSPQASPDTSPHTHTSPPP